jgi:S-adenosyl methyltransferase
MGPDLGFVKIDITAAHSARAYDYLLGGVTNFAVDREAVERTTASSGGIEMARRRVRANRRFLGRAVRYLAGDAGVRQFLDIGTGIPNADNVHAVAQATAPDCRVVSVDNDHVVLAHAHELRRSAPGGAAAYINGDMRNPEDILSQAAATLDFSEPVAVMFFAMLHTLRDAADPWAIVARFVEGVPSGSYLAISHMAAEAEEMAELGRAVKEDVPAVNCELVPRRHAEVARFFEGVELIEPGLVRIDHWRPDEPLPEHETPSWGGVGRKP